MLCFALFVCLFVFFVLLLLLLFCKSFSLHAPTHSPYMVLRRVEPSLHPVLPENKAICTTVTLFATDLTGSQYRHPISSSNHNLNWMDSTQKCKMPLTPCFLAANVTLCNVSSSTNGRTASWSITWNKQIKVNKNTKRNATTDRHWCTDWISFEKQFWIEFLT